MGKGGKYEYERMLLDSIIMFIMCIVFLPQCLAVSQEVLLSMDTLGRDGWVRAGYLTFFDCI